jgi:hypothetical protein
VFLDNYPEPKTPPSNPSEAVPPASGQQPGSTPAPPAPSAMIPVDKKEDPTIAKEWAKTSPYYEVFRKINQFQYNGNLWYLQGNYEHAFEELRLAQGLLKDTYHQISEIYLEDTRALLESVSPSVIQANDSIAKFYVRTAFRDFRYAEDRYKIARSTNPYQYRYKIQQYSEGIRYMRRAKRYALLALVSSKIPLEEKDEYKMVGEHKNKENYIVESHSVYEKLRNRLVFFIQDKKIERFYYPQGNTNNKPFDVIETHDDNYGYITQFRRDLLVEVGKEVKENDARERQALPAVLTP